MPRKGADPDVDGDYDPYDSFEEERRVRQRTAPEGPVVRSSRGRPVKVSDCSAYDNLHSAALILVLGILTMATARTMRALL